jgi:TonB family protein
MSAMRIGVPVLVVVYLAVLPNGLAAEPVRGNANSLDSILFVFPAGYTHPIPLLETDVRPHALSIPAPEYPEMTRQAGIEGLTLVEALVDVDGSVTEAKVLRSAGCLPLDQSAVQAAKEAKFQPAMQDGRPVPVRVVIPYRFALTWGKETAPASSGSAVTVTALTLHAEVRDYSDSVLKPVRDLHFVRLMRIADWDSTHERLEPDSATIRSNNEAMMAACAAFRHRRGGFLRRPASYCLQSDWYYLVVAGGRCRVFLRNYDHYRRAEVYDVDSLTVVPDGLNADYVEMPGWTSLPEYVPLRLEFVAGKIRHTIQAQAFGLEVQ